MKKMNYLGKSLILLVISQVVYSANNCGGAAVCEDFEKLSGTPSGLWAENFPNCKGTGKSSIDETVAHSGKKSLRVDGGGNYCNHVFVKLNKDLSSIGNVLFFRMYVRHKTPLSPNHVTFIAMHDSTDNKDLRIGGQNSRLQWNREMSDATLPEQSPQGVAQSVVFPTDKWVCLEYMVDSSGKAQTWVDGKEVVGLHAGSGKPDVDHQWMSVKWTPKLTDLRLGWESYGEMSDTLWFDDVAVGTKRINC